MSYSNIFNQRMAAKQAQKQRILNAIQGMGEGMLNKEKEREAIDRQNEIEFLKQKRAYAQKQMADEEKYRGMPPEVATRMRAQERLAQTAPTGGTKEDLFASIRNNTLGRETPQRAAISQWLADDEAKRRRAMAAGGRAETRDIFDTETQGVPDHVKALRALRAMNTPGGAQAAALIEKEMENKDKELGFADETRGYERGRRKFEETEGREAVRAGWRWDEQKREYVKDAELEKVLERDEAERVRREKAEEREYRSGVRKFEEKNRGRSAELIERITEAERVGGDVDVVVSDYLRERRERMKVEQARIQAEVDKLNRWEPGTAGDPISKYTPTHVRMLINDTQSEIDKLKFKGRVRPADQAKYDALMERQEKLRRAQQIMDADGPEAMRAYLATIKPGGGVAEPGEKESGEFGSIFDRGARAPREKPLQGREALDSVR